MFVGVTRLPAAQQAMVQFGGAMAVDLDTVTIDWATAVVDFVIHGVWVFAVPLVVGTVLAVVRKQTFDTLNIYDTGIGFWDSKHGTLRYAPYSDIEFSYGKMQESFLVEAKTASVKLTEYVWKEFAQQDVLRSNLEQYGTWH
ncbi:MAG: hypothetical protein LBL86_04695 [Coriobacteriales bacterium]|nr:hypothetical protein [Coriobacteriales bacterium]